MKQTTIPYLAWTSDSLEGLALAMETGARRLSVDTPNWEADYPYCPLCSVDVAYNERGILLHYFVRGLDLRTLSAGDGQYVHEDSCVEFFMQRERGEAYINFEFNAAGVCYASHHSSPREGCRFEPREFASIARLATYAGERIEMRPGIHQWELSALVPWTTMGYAEGEIPERLWANFYKCADGTSHPHYLSWAPIEEATPAFHRPQFFGVLELEGKARGERAHTNCQ